MDAKELERRRLVWKALAEVFLDTETRWYFPRIAGVLVESGYATEELERIWRWEMVPECAWNIYQVAGEWAIMPLDEAALVRRASRPPSFLTRLFRRVHASFIQDQWRQILELTARVRSLPPDDRARIIQAWSAFATAYLEESLEKLLFLDRDVSSLRSCGLTRARCESTFTGDFRPIYSQLLIGKERSSEPTRALNVTTLIERAFER